MQSYPACPRCYSEDEVLRPWAGFRVVRGIWLAGVVGVVTCAPILFSDIVVMIPCTVAFLFAGGPVLAYAKEPPTCRTCGLARPHPGWHETPCRPVRAVPSEGSDGGRIRGGHALALHAHEQTEPLEQSGVRALPSEREPS